MQQCHHAGVEPIICDISLISIAPNLSHSLLPHLSHLSLLFRLFRLYHLSHIVSYIIFHISRISSVIM